MHNLTINTVKVCSVDFMMLPYITYSGLLCSATVLFCVMVHVIVHVMKRLMPSDTPITTLQKSN